MNRNTAIKRRLDRIQAKILPHQQEQADEEAEESISATLLRKLECIKQCSDADGTIDWDEMTACMRRVEGSRTPEERAILAQYERRHPSRGARDELLARLSRSVKDQRE